jgi:hypothetical protein
MRQASKESVRGQCVCPSQLYILDIALGFTGNPPPSSSDPKIDISISFVGGGVGALVSLCFNLDIAVIRWSLSFDLLTVFDIHAFCFGSSCTSSFLSVVVLGGCSIPVRLVLANGISDWWRYS